MLVKKSSHSTDNQSKSSFKEKQKQYLTGNYNSQTHTDKKQYSFSPNNRSSEQQIFSSSKSNQMNNTASARMAYSDRVKQNYQTQSQTAHAQSAQNQQPNLKSNHQNNSKYQSDQDNQDKKANQQENQYQAPQIDWEESKIVPRMIKPIPEKDLLTWEAINRPFKKRNKQYMMTVFVIAALFVLILIFVRQALPAAVVIAMTLLIYILNVIPPAKSVFKITNYGIKADDKYYFWEQMGRFWFTKKYKYRLLNIELFTIQGKLTIVLSEKITNEQVRTILSEVLLEEKPEPTLYEKLADKLQKKFPIDLEK